MKIQTVNFSNFRLFKRFACTFEKDITVLVGLNAQGKTSILDGIAIAMSQLVSGFGTAKDIGITNQDVRLEKFQTKEDASEEDGAFALAARYHMEYQFPVEIKAALYEHDVLPTSWTRTRKTLKGRTSQVKPLQQVALAWQKKVQEGEDVTLPLFANYGTDRLGAQKKFGASSKRRADSRLSAYADALSSASNYVFFQQWLKQEAMANMEYHMRCAERGEIPKKTARQQLLQAVTEAIDIVLAPSSWGGLRYSAIHDAVVATHPLNGEMPVTYLSDGVRTTIGMVADIAYRMVQLNPHLLENAAKETPGIILIDEIGLHLHPRWQQLILQSLHKAFPALQIIATTHSPQVLTTAKRRQIRLLTVENQIDPDFDFAPMPMGETYAEASQDLLERVMHVATRPPLPQVQKFQAYMRLIDLGQAQTEEALALRAELCDMLGEAHSDLLRADRAILRKELLG